MGCFRLSLVLCQGHAGVELQTDPTCLLPATARDPVPGEYSELLSSSIFCLVMPGDGWSARMDDATLHGWVLAWALWHRFPVANGTNTMPLQRL